MNLFMIKNSCFLSQIIKFKKNESIEDKNTEKSSIDEKLEDKSFDYYWEKFKKKLNIYTIMRR